MPQNRYTAIIERIFLARYSPGATSIRFERNDIVATANELGIPLPANFGDLIYSFRFRAALPDAIASTAVPGKAWIIRLGGRGRYRFDLVRDQPIVPNEQMLSTKIPDATPGIITRYALSDEQALLAKVRYNRLVDIFTGVTCYSLQNHLRTTVPEMGQIETDEVYVGVEKRGVHYVIPVQAKGGSDRLSIVQIEQDIALCAAKFPGLSVRPVACQFLNNDVIVMFEFGESAGEVGIVAEKHYELAPSEEITSDDLASYSQQT